jgi:hypothetical protein
MGTMRIADPDRASSELRLVAPGSTGDRRIRLGTAGLSAQQLRAGADLGGEGQRGCWVNSAAGSFGLSFGLAFSGAIMLATLAFNFTSLAEQSRAQSCRHPTRSGSLWLSRRMPNS